MPPGGDLYSLCIGVQKTWIMSIMVQKKPTHNTPEEPVRDRGHILVKDLILRSLQGSQTPYMAAQGSPKCRSGSCQSDAEVGTASLFPVLLVRVSYSPAPSQSGRGLHRLRISRGWLIGATFGDSYLGAKD